METTLRSLTMLDEINRLANENKSLKSRIEQLENELKELKSN